MNDIIPNTEYPSIKRTTSSSSRRWKYLSVGIVSNALLWGASFLYLTVFPSVFTSKWALILPESGSGVNVNLPTIGQATSSGNSALSSSTMDIRANYQFIATDEDLLQKVAKDLNLSVKELGKPKVKLVDNTTIMEFTINAPTPENARERALAINDALQIKLNSLRAQEINKRGENNQSTLDSARKKLQAAQKNLSNYKASSGLTSVEQVRDLSNNIELLRKQKAEISAQTAQVTSRFEQLSTSLGLTVPEAADAFILHADRQFQQNAKDFSEANASLAVMLAKWDNNHPLVVKERARLESGRVAMLKRGSSILQKNVTPKYVERLVISDSNNSSRESLFRDLIAFRAEQEGAISQNQSLEEQIDQLETRLLSLAQKQSGLDSLLRDIQIAEAVFASTLAKVDLSKSDIYNSYPLVQVLAEPSLPDAQTSPNSLYVFLGAGIASILITAGLILLWWRGERQLQLVPKTSLLDSSDL